MLSSRNIKRDAEEALGSSSPPASDRASRENKVAETIVISDSDNDSDVVMLSRSNIVPINKMGRRFRRVLPESSDEESSSDGVRKRTAEDHTNDSNEHIKKYRVQVKDLEDRLELSQRQLNQKNDEISNLMESRQNLFSIANQQTAELKIVSSKLETAQVQLSKATGDLEAQRESFILAEKEAIETTKQLQEAHKENSGLRQENHDLQQEIRDFRQVNSGLQRDIGVLEDKQAGLSLTMDEQSAKLLEAHSDLQKARDEMKALEEQGMELAEETSLTKSEVHGLKKRLQESHDKINELESQIKNCKFCSKPKAFWDNVRKTTEEVARNLQNLLGEDKHRASLPRLFEESKP